MSDEPTRDPAAGAEQRWRRTVDMRGPTKLKVGRLLRDFGFGDFGLAALQEIEARLASVGLLSAPRLSEVEADGIVTLTPAPNAAEVAPAVPPPVAARPPAAAATPAPAPQAGPPQPVTRPAAGDGSPGAGPAGEDEDVFSRPGLDLPPADGSEESQVRAENIRLLEERAETERRLEARAREARRASRGVATLSDALGETRAEIQRTAAELRLALDRKSGQTADASEGSSEPSEQA